MSTVSLILNEDDVTHHLEVIKINLAKAGRFICMVAFAKRSGYNEIKALLKKRIAKGMKATFVVGIDFYQSEPEVLSSLLELKKGGKVDVYMGATGRDCTFHPKLYIFERRNRVKAIVGSANLTGGGLCNNYELSALLEGTKSELTAIIDAWILQLLDLKEIVEVDEALIADYARRKNIHDVQTAIAKKAMQNQLSKPITRFDALRDILQTMKADTSERGFYNQIKVRNLSLVEADKVLKAIISTRPLSSQQFLDLYTQLAKDLWHSGGLERGKNVLASNAAGFQSVLSSLSTVTPQSQAHLFNHLRNGFMPIDRAGTNVITEILHTLDKTKFAVMNQNSVAGLKKAEFQTYPEKPNKKNVDGALYAKFCNDADAVRDALGLADFSELDALLNYAYWP
jgi:HKD family nuclease